MNIAVPSDFVNDGINEDVKKAYDTSIKTLEDLGANIVNVKLEYAKYSLATYYIIATAEAS